MKKIILPLLSSLAMFDATAEWVFDSSAKTLTHDSSGVVIKNVSTDKNNDLTINQQVSATDYYAYGMLDFTEAISDGNGNTYYLKTIGENAFYHCKGITGFIAPPTLTKMANRTFQDSGIVTFDLSRATNLTSVGYSMLQDAFDLTGDIVFPDSLTSFSGWTFSRAGINADGFNVYFGASIAPNYIDYGNGGMFAQSHVSKIDFSKLASLSIAEKAFRETPKLSLVLLPANLGTLPKYAFNWHRPEYPLLEVYFRNCPFSNLKENPFSEMFNKNNSSYKVTESDIENSNVIIYIPRISPTAGTPNWNTYATQWVNLANNSPEWKNDPTKKILTLPATEDGEGLYITDYEKTGLIWSDAAVRVKYWDDPIQLEISSSIPRYTINLNNYSKTSVSINTYMTVLPDEATEVKITFAAYSDPEHTKLVTYTETTLTTEFESTTLTISNLKEGETYFFSVVGVDNQATPQTGDYVDLGAINSWIYDSEKQTLTIGGNLIDNTTTLKNVTESDGVLLLAQNQLLTDDTLDLTYPIYGGYIITSIPRSAFINNDSLKHIYLPQWVTNIGEYAFSDCSNLETLTGEAISVIGRSAFSGCGKFTGLGTMEGVTTIGAVAFNGCYEYQGDLILTNLVNTSIPANTFENCYKITSVTLGENVVAIEEKAFHKTYACSNVVFLAERIETLGKCAFGGQGKINNSGAAERSVYMKNVPNSLQPFLAETHAQPGPTDEQIANEDTIVTMYIPYYDGVVEDAANGVTSGNEFIANAIEWQKADIPALTGDGSTFILPINEDDIGIWYKKHNNWGGYIVHVAYYNELIQGTLILVK